ncbi:MAG TPA: PmoA family protein [Bryobacteraceae bacterium]|jgi:Methane oxygenase PmoA|nr:PmoA family protein [Bryobacteraceae bacterium]
MKKTGKVSLAVMVCCFTCVAQQNVEVQRKEKQIEITIGGKPFTTYYFDEAVAKPYLMPLRSAQGTIVTRGYPVGNEVPPGSERDKSFEPHQRPLYFAHGNIGGLDFWGEEVFAKFFNDHGKQEYGHMVMEKIDEARGGDAGVIKAQFSLQGPRGRVIGDETQAFTFRGDDHTRVIDCEFTVRATNGPLTFGDSKEGTFGIRVAKELDSPPAHMVNSQGAEGEKAIWGKRADWVDYDGKVEGEDLGIAVLDHPKSFRHPTTWHARGYGLLAANPFGLRDFTRDPNQDGSWTIPERKSLTFRYRVVIHHGDYKTANIAEAYQKYAAEP